MATTTTTIKTLPCFLSLIFLLIFTSFLPSTTSKLCNKHDQKALLALKTSFNHSDPFPTWTPIFDCCDWYGVTCNQTTGRVYSLDLTTDLTGVVPPALGDLPTLQVLRLHKVPNLHSPIPHSITKLKLLRFLTISWGSLSGPIPTFLSQLPSLESLDLSFNQLSGNIPPSLGHLPALRVIDLSRNHLTGTIPETLFHIINPKTTFPTLILSHNNLTGPIPSSFANVDFAALDVSRNKLTGNPSFLFGQSKSADTIVLARNQFKFDLSRVVFPENVDVLQLEHNMIYGSIPNQITMVSTLQFFNVSYNRLCGEIPTGGQLGSFDEYSFIHNKCLCGTPLPPCK